jgi:mono/diheme cytochrome c family protein
MSHAGLRCFVMLALIGLGTTIVRADEPKKEEPKKEDAKQAEVKKDDAKKSAASILDEALKSAPVTNEPAKPEPKKAEPAKNEAAKVEPAKTGPVTFEADIRPLMQKYCYDCHGQKKQRAGLNLEKYADQQSVLEGRKVWEHAATMIRSREMPPKRRSGVAPTQEERDRLYQWITETTSKIDCTGSHDPGRVTVRRLNRFEYNNTIRDLVGVDFKPAADFPSDDVGYGFDNIGDVLSLPPILFEKYLTAAEKITAAAIGAEPLRGVTEVFEGDKLQGGSAGANGTKLLASSGKVSAEVNVAADANYVLRITAFEMHAGNEFAKMGFLLDDKQLHEFDVKGRAEVPQSFALRLPLKAGKHTIAGAFLNDFYDPKDPDPKNRDRNMGIATIELQGPIEASTEKKPVSPLHRKIFVRTPKPDMSNAEDCARAILGSFARRAFRRAVSREELDRYVDLSRSVMLDGESFDRAIEVSIQAILVSPYFLFRVETDAEPDNPKAVHPITEFELASRLSYFLWSSMPDDELLKLAEQNALRNGTTLKQQIDRMLKDPKAQSFIESFSGQWLQTRNLKQMTPDPKMFPTFDDQLREAMRLETELFFGEIVRGNHSILDLLDADFTFVNERLAKHYGLSGVTGEKFQRVKLDGQKRAGVLTQASILTLTSNPTRTSPVKRGKWVLENILGSPPPPPPPDVEELKNDEKDVLSGSLRQRMEQHRSNPSCASCHQKMDPLGFGFENFDAIGGWRTQDGKFDIDPAGVLPSGDSFKTPKELRETLKKFKTEFARCLTEKMLTYAIGRGLEYYDKCTVDSLVQKLEQDNYRIGGMIEEIVQSDPFQKRRGKKERE